MARNSNVTEEELRAMLQQVADRIEHGGNDMTSVTLKALTDDGEIEHTFSLKTEDERTAALLALRTLLGQVH